MALSRVCIKLFATSKSLWNVNSIHNLCYRHKISVFLPNHGVACVSSAIVTGQKHVTVIH